MDFVCYYRLETPAIRGLPLNDTSGLRISPGALINEIKYITIVYWLYMSIESRITIVRLTARTLIFLFLFIVAVPFAARTVVIISHAENIYSNAL